MSLSNKTLAVMFNIAGGKISLNVLLDSALSQFCFIYTRDILGFKQYLHDLKILLRCSRIHHASLLWCGNM